MVAADDYYRLLQVDPSADAEVIRAAYRALAQKHHPDAGGSKQAMADLNRAWAVLGDPHARRVYDRQHAVAAIRAEAAAQAKAEPPTNSSTRGVVLEFGQYRGWSLIQIAQQDPDYLRWLARTPSGRTYRADIELLVGPSGPSIRGMFAARRAPAG